MNGVVSPEASRAFIAYFGPAPAEVNAVEVAVKANVDIAGHRTSAGNRIVYEVMEPAAADAAILATIKAAGGHAVGVTNMNSLAYGSNGGNPYYGRPINPIDAALVPGGSSSGSAVAVANGHARVAIGTDTGGSIRIPAHCTQVVGLKTTAGRLPLDGIWPLAPRLDTVGPLTRTVADMALAMTMFEPGFAAASADDVQIGYLQLEAVHDSQQQAVLEALKIADFPDIAVSERDNDRISKRWDWAVTATSDLLVAEMAISNQRFRRTWSLFGEQSKALLHGEELLADRDRMSAVDRVQHYWSGLLRALLQKHDVVALPTMDRPVPTWDELAANPKTKLSRLVNPVNLAGLPALSMPLGVEAGTPRSIQLVGRPNGEALLISAGHRIEQALAEQKNGHQV